MHEVLAPKQLATFCILALLKFYDNININS